MAHGLVTRLEGDVEDFQTRARTAEEAAARAEATADLPAPEDDELLLVVFDGQRRADALVEAAEAEAARIHRAADDRIAVLRDDAEVVRLRALVAERAGATAAAVEAVAAAEDDLRAVAEATEACRRVVGDRLAAVLDDLRRMGEPVLAGVRSTSTSGSTSGSTERT